jgi:hypothetical protein
MRTSLQVSRRAALVVVTTVFAARASAQQTVTSIVSTATTAITRLRDSTSLHKAGYFAIGFGGGVKDLTPFQGQHWLQVRRFAANPPVSLTEPNFFMYLPVGDSLIPIGVAYSRRVPVDTTLPADLSGVAAEWHSHIFCRNIQGEGNVLADGPDDCKERGGIANPNQIAMVHTWTVPNPDGPFAHDNPALPYIATGLKPPARAAHDERLFAVALGESYGARLVAAHRITIFAERTGAKNTLAEHRATLRTLVAQLRDAERANDASKAQAARKKIADEWTALAAEYRRIAPTPEMKARFDLELDQATGVAAHHHM